MDAVKIDEEKLREAACYGDLDAIRIFINKGVNLNAQHSINGWTALHWAAKRNQPEVARLLISSGADANVSSFSNEVPADLTNNPAILNLLGSPKTKLPDTSSSSNPVVNGHELPIIPHYLANSNIGYKVDLTESPSKIARINVNDTSTVKDIVLKVRLAYSTDEDFIEVEVPKSQLTYAKLMEVCCSELGLNPKYVERLRKLPNTKLRNDKDVQRIVEFQEIEVVLVGSRPKPVNSQENSSSQSIVGPAIKNQMILY